MMNRGMIRAIRRRTALAGGCSLLLGLGACREPPGVGQADGALSEATIQSLAIAPAVVDTVRCVGGDAATEVGCAFDPVQEVALQGTDTWVIARGVLSRIDSAGRVSVAARSGGGPGELRAPIAIGDAAIARGVSVFDIANTRLSTLSGAHAPEEASVMPAPYFRNMRIRGGVLYAYTVPPAASLGDSVVAVILRYAADGGGWTDTVARFVDRAVSVVGSGGQALPRLPWDRSLLWDVCGNGEVVTAFSDQWTVRRFRTGRADVTDSIYRPAFRAEPMSEAEHAALSAQALDAAPRLPAFRDALAKRLTDKPATRLPLRQLFCTEAGAAVIVNAPSAGASDYLVDVIGTDALPSRRWRVPAAIRLTGAYGEVLAGVQEAEDGRATVVRVRLAP